MKNELNHLIKWLKVILLLTSIAIIMLIAIVVAPFYAIGDMIAAILPKIKRLINRTVNADHRQTT